MGKLDSLVCRLLPAVIFEMAAKINGVTSLPLMPLCSAFFSALLIESLMTASAIKRILDCYARVAT